MAQNQFDALPATIANGASLSSTVPLQQRHVVAIVMPAAWTAAPLTLRGSADGLAFADVFDFAGAELAIQAAASRYIYLPPNALAGFQSIQVRSGTTGAAVNQGAERVLTLIVRPYA